RHQRQYRCRGGQTACDQCVNGGGLALLDQALSLAFEPVLDGSDGRLEPYDTKNVAKHQLRPPRPIIPITTPTSNGPASAPRGLLRPIRSNSEANVLARSVAASAMPPICSVTSEVVFFALSKASLLFLLMRFVTVSFRLLKSARNVSRSALTSPEDPG